MTGTDALQIFRSECRNYGTYEKEREQLKAKIDHVQYQINGVHSVRFEKSYTQPSRYNNHSILGKVEVKTLLQIKLAAVETKIAWIEDCINAIPYPFHRVVAWRVYIIGDSFNRVSRDYEVDREHLRKMNKRLIEGVLNEACMTKWKDAKEQYAYSKTIIIRMYQESMEQGG